MCARQLLSRALHDAELGHGKEEEKYTSSSHIRLNDSSLGMETPLELRGVHYDSHKMTIFSHCPNPIQLVSGPFLRYKGLDVLCSNG